MRWSAEALAQGTHPSSRHDGTAWHQTDRVRSHLGGLGFGWRAAFVWLKGDWAEFAHTFGLPSWSHGTHPCPLCHCTQRTMHRLEGYSPLSMPFPAKTQAEYDAACRACELEVLVPDRATLEALRARLEEDRRPGGSRGRALLADFPALGLLKGDRLEPSTVLPDVCEVDSWVGGGRLSFWRPSQETLTLHRNPLLTEGLCSVPDCLQVDWLHAMSLGIFQDYLGFLFAWLFYEHGLYATRGTRPQRLGVSVQRLEQALFVWYAKEQQAGRYHTRVQRLKAGMFGTYEMPTCTLHGSETNAVLLFAKDLLVEAGIEGPWLQAAQALAHLYLLIKRHPHRMPANDIQDEGDP